MKTEEEYYLAYLEFVPTLSPAIMQACLQDLAWHINIIQQDSKLSITQHFRGWLGNKLARDVDKRRRNRKRNAT